jgi:RNA 3'-terminal phosphate cyclase (ATP)
VQYVDGSTGGGQVLRTALSCAALRSEAVRVEHVRGGRSTPGLRAQHRAAVEAVAAVCDADVEGVHEGSETVVLDPGPVTGGEVCVDVGTAGAVTLVFDAVLLLATRLDDPLELTVTGGTDVRWAPTLDYYDRVKRPLLARVGFDIAVPCARRGFYPAGGGRATLRLAPAAPAPLAFDARGPLSAIGIHVRASDSLAGADVAERACEGARSALDGDGHVPGVADAVVETRPSYAPAESPGASLLVEGRYRTSVAGFVALGEQGKPAEDVGEEAATAFADFQAGEAAVDEHAADQLLLALALGGGRLRAPALTDHVRTNRETRATFGYDISVTVVAGTALLAAGRDRS